MRLEDPTKLFPCPPVGRSIGQGLFPVPALAVPARAGHGPDSARTEHGIAASSATSQTRGRSAMIQRRASGSTGAIRSIIPVISSDGARTLTVVQYAQEGGLGEMKLRA